MRLRKRPEATRKQQKADREASWLKEVRKVKRVDEERKNEKVGDKTQGGESEKNW